MEETMNLNILEAINQALDQAMASDKSVVG